MVEFLKLLVLNMFLVVSVIAFCIVVSFGFIHWDKSRILNRFIVVGCLVLTGGLFILSLIGYFSN